ncbi:MAG: hypothetical protein ABIH63_04235 [archaeon]
MNKMFFIFLILFSTLSVYSVWGQERFEAPIWNVGDEWQYTFSEFGRRVFVTHKVVKITENFYFVAMGGFKGLHVYDKKTLNIRFYIDEGNRKHEFKDSLRKLFDFPMFVGKSWNDEFIKRNEYAELNITISNHFNVEEFEKRNQSLGLFDVLRVYCKETATIDDDKDKTVTRWLRYWYSPKVKNLVRQEIGEKSNFVSSSSREIVLHQHTLKE